MSIRGLLHGKGRQRCEFGRQGFALASDNLDGEGFAAPWHGGQQAGDLGQLVSGREFARLRVKGELVFVLAEEEDERVAGP